MQKVYLQIYFPVNFVTICSFFHYFQVVIMKTVLKEDVTCTASSVYVNQTKEMMPTVYKVRQQGGTASCTVCVSLRR